MFNRISKHLDQGSSEILRYASYSWLPPEFPKSRSQSPRVFWCRPKDTWALGRRLEFSMFGNVIKQALSCLMYDISVVVTLSLSPLQKMSNLFRRGKSSEWEWLLACEGDFQLDRGHIGGPLSVPNESWTLVLCKHSFRSCKFAWLLATWGKMLYWSGTIISLRSPSLGLLLLGFKVFNVKYLLVK